MQSNPRKNAFDIFYLVSSTLTGITINEAENGLIKSEIVSLQGPAKVNKVKIFSGSYHIIKRIPKFGCGCSGASLAKFCRSK